MHQGTPLETSKHWRRSNWIMKPWTLVLHRLSPFQELFWMTDIAQGWTWGIWTGPWAVPLCSQTESSGDISPWMMVHLAFLLRAPLCFPPAAQPEVWTVAHTNSYHVAIFPNSNHYYRWVQGYLSCSSTFHSFHVRKSFAALWNLGNRHTRWTPASSSSVGWDRRGP